MKKKAQKAEELKKGEDLVKKSQILVLADFSKVGSEDVRKLRGEMKSLGATLMVLKKRLLGVLLKKHGIDFDVKQFKASVGTVFSSVAIDTVSVPVFKFFSGLPIPEGGEKDMFTKKILGAYDVTGKNFLDAKQVVFIGKLPSREVLLGQLFGMISSPIRSFLYVLDQKSKRS